MVKASGGKEREMKDRPWEVEARVCSKCSAVIPIPFAHREYVRETLKRAEAFGIDIASYTCIVCRGGTHWEIFNTGPEEK